MDNNINNVNAANDGKDINTVNANNENSNNNNVDNADESSRKLLTKIHLILACIFAVLFMIGFVIKAVLTF